MEEKQNTSPIELRSEKVRRIIGDIPHGLVYWGTTIIVIIFALLIAVCPIHIATGNLFFATYLDSCTNCHQG